MLCDGSFHVAPLDPVLAGLLRCRDGISVMLESFRLLPQARGKERPPRPTFCRTLRINRLSVFYREADPNDAPTLLLLHGLPSSSRMFEPLFARLSDRYHLVAPDYLGSRHSDWLDPSLRPSNALNPAL